MVMCYRLKLCHVLGSKGNESETSADFDAGGTTQKAVHIAVGGIPSGNKQAREQEALLSENDVAPGVSDSVFILVEQVKSSQRNSKQHKSRLKVQLRKRSRPPLGLAGCCCMASGKAKKDGIDDCLPSLSQSKQHNHSQRERQPIIIRHDFHIPLHRCSNEPPCASRTAKYQRYMYRRRRRA